MKRFFSPWSWSLASLFSGTALALPLFGAVNVGAAIVMSATSEIRPTANARAGTGLLVDWNQDVIVHSNLNAQDAVRPALPTLSPEEPKTPDATISTDKSATSDTTANEESDYYKFKFGRFGGYYGQNADATSSAEKPLNGTTTENNDSHNGDNNPSGETKTSAEKPANGTTTDNNDSHNGENKDVGRNQNAHRNACQRHGRKRQRQPKWQQR